MIKVECDKCGRSASRCNYEIRVLPLINTTPQYFNEGGDAKLTCEESNRIRFILCQDCYRDLGLPNVYKANASAAFKTYPLAFWLHVADEAATFLTEKEES